jgi:hypothetical protein
MLRMSADFCIGAGRNVTFSVLADRTLTLLALLRLPPKQVKL